MSLEPVHPLTGPASSMPEPARKMSCEAYEAASTRSTVPAPSLSLRVAGALLAWALRAWTTTLRIRWEGDAHQLEATCDGPCIYALWHGDQLPLLVPFRGPGRTILVSWSRDGSLLNEVVRRLGYNTVRGSSSRGGAEALQALNAALVMGQSVVFAVDGPRGPRHHVKPGAVRAAMRSGRPVLAVGMHGRGFRLRSWDRFFIPFPFTRLVIRRAPPLYFQDGPALARLEPLEHALSSVTGPLPAGSRSRPGRLRSGDEPAPQSRLWAMLYQGITRLVAPLVYLLWLVAALVRPDWRAGWRQRLGLAPMEAHPDGLWVHAVSVGEVGVARTLIDALSSRRRHPSIRLTTMTTAGLRVATMAGIPGVGLAPLDLPGPLERTFRRLRPSALILIETELWSGQLMGAVRHRVPVIVVNARLSERTFARYHRWRALFAPLLGHCYVIARTREDAARFRALGVRHERCRVGGDLKQMASSGPEVRLPASLEAWMQEGPVIVAASTHPGEEQVVLEAIQPLRARWPSLRLLVAPRHPERFPNSAFWAAAPRRRQLEAGVLDAEVLKRAYVFVLDTVGELQACFPFASAVFVGGSLVPIGGHNLLEVARAGRVCLYGPHIGGVKAQAGLLEGVGAGVPVRDGQDLSAELERLLDAPDVADRRGAAGRSALIGHEDMLERLLDQLEIWLEGSGERAR